ncbi:MAG: DNA polymerase III subunit delta [Deltaproteobacteria bacterium]|nr:DNA polymerase III subunit delta [Deltaproteobacteria bacterium]
MEKTKPVHYFFGEEDYLMEEALGDIKRLVLSKGFESLNYHVYEGKTLSAPEVIRGAKTMPAFSAGRVVLVNGAEELGAEEAKEFLDYAKSPSPSTCLIFIARGRKLDWGSEFFKYLKAQGYAREYKKLTGDGLRRWVKGYAMRGEKEITPAAAERLLYLAGDNLRDIKGELDKVMTFTGETNRIDEGDIESCANPVRDFDAFDLAGAIGRKDIGGAMRALSGLSEEEPLKLLGAIAWHFRTLLKVRAYQKKGVEAYRLAGLVRISRENLDRCLKAARNFSDIELLRALTRLASADIEFKSSRLPHGFIMTDLVMELCGKGGLRPQH